MQLKIKRLAVLAAFSIIACSAWAQAPVLLEACNALNESAKRLECFKQAAATTAQDDELKRFKSRTLGIQAALNGEVSYSQYEALTIEYARHLGLFKSGRPADEVTALLDEAAQAYEDTRTFWIRTNRYASRDRDLVDPDDMKDLGMPNLVVKYSIPLTVVHWNKWIARKDARKAMWSYAEERTRKAFEIAERR